MNEKNKPEYDGSRLRHHELWSLLEMEYERQMWENWKKVYPDGFPWNKVLIDSSGIKGKAMIMSTAYLDDSGKDFRELWTDSADKKESGLYRIFRPACNNDIDDYGFKKDDDEHTKRKDT